MTDFVFVGPSLAADDVGELLPGAVVLPPIRHGDLLRLAPQDGDRVLIVDGLFMQSAPVRHREILAALDRGTIVAGSSSMGALRAAELWQFGMRGVGTVFEHYRDGVISGDDEVAVLYGPAEDGYPLLSRPLIDLRLSLAAAAADGVVTEAEADVLLARVRAMPFRERSVAALRHRCAARTDGSLDQYLRWSAGRSMDVKGDDARRLLQAARNGALTRRDAADRPIENVCTYLFERWQARHTGAQVGGRFVSDADAVGVIRALHPDLPALHRRDVLRTVAGDDTIDAAVALARERGLWHGTDLDAALTRYLAPSECGLRAEDQVVRVMVRALGAAMSGPLSRTGLPAELASAEVLAAARHFARKAMAVNDRLPHTDPRNARRRMFFRAEVVDDVMAGVWGVASAELESCARDRGLRDLVRLRAVVEPFVGLLKLSGRPAFAPTPSVLAETQ